jgi:hypothetical protein
MSDTRFRMSRRKFTRGATLMAVAGSIRPLALAQTMVAPTAAQVVNTIKKHLNMTWNDKTYRDTFKAGDPNTPVKGIASCFMSTLDVLQRSHALGLNFVITRTNVLVPIRHDRAHQERLALSGKASLYRKERHGGLSDSRSLASLHA